MKVHLIKKKTIEAYVRNHPSGRSGFSTWMSTLNFADWKEPNDIIATFNSADILGESSSRVVFNIAGNHYRVICSYYFGRDQVHLFVNWIGTHAEYDKVCKKEEQYNISKY